jgi:alkanesulfonate monooxygenase SsuD/methylene tetrahydromethanopterin reductase-like flavin-dependent oxidoreductase (luciferase family)
MTDEAIEVMQTLWREPVAHYHGQFHHHDAVSMPPHPPEGGPPIWIGGNTPGAIQRAAQYDSGGLPFAMDLDAFRASVTALRELTRERECPTIANEFYFHITKPDEPAVEQPTTPGMPPPFTGSPDVIALHLEQYRQAGLEYALCLFQAEGVDDLLRQMRLFAEEVAPRFTEAG